MEKIFKFLRILSLLFFQEYFFCVQRVVRESAFLFVIENFMSVCILLPYVNF